MNWEFVNTYAFETMGQVRRTALPTDWSTAEREANIRAWNRYGGGCGGGDRDMGEEVSDGE